MTSRSYLLQRRLRLFNVVITPTLGNASGTWTLSEENERMIRPTQRKMLRLIVQTVKIQRKTQPSRHEEDGKANHRSSDEETAEGSSSNTDCDQDSDISFMKDTDLNVISLIRNSSVPFPNAWSCPFSSDAILSGYEDLVSSGSDHFTMWGKMSPHEILAEHVVDIHKVLADFRDAFERNQSSSSQTHGVNKYFSSQSLAQRRLSIYSWNPGPRRGKEDAFEKQIAEK